jgi:hypothetical protein
MVQLVSLLFACGLLIDASAYEQKCDKPDQIPMTCPDGQHCIGTGWGTRCVSDNEEFIEEGRKCTEHDQLPITCPVGQHCIGHGWNTMCVKDGEDAAELPYVVCRDIPIRCPKEVGCCDTGSGTRCCDSLR